MLDVVDMHGILLVWLCAAVALLIGLVGQPALLGLQLDGTGRDREAEAPLCPRVWKRHSSGLSCEPDLSHISGYNPSAQEAVAWRGYRNARDDRAQPNPNTDDQESSDDVADERDQEDGCTMQAGSWDCAGRVMAG